jgi:alanyl aminopeptidase
MLELWLGEDVFRAGVRQYIHTHEWGNATAQDLLDALAAASHQDVSAVAASFLDRPGVPVVQLDLACTGPTPSVTITQSRYTIPAGASASSAPPSAASSASPSPGNEQPWRVPVCFVFELNGRGHRQCTLLSESSATVPLEGATRCPRWIDPNAEQAGYYRYAITPPVRALAQPATLRTLDVLARIGLVDDAWAMVRAGRMGIDEFLGLLASFRSERERAVVETMLSAIAEIYNDFVTDADRPAFSRYIGTLLRPLATELGWNARRGEPDDRRLLRRMVISAMGNLAEDASIAAEAERRTVAYLRDPSSVDPDVASIAVPIASRRAGADRLAALTEFLGHARTPADRVTAIAGLAGFGDPALLRRALDLALTPAVRVQDIFRLVYGAWNHPLRRPIVTAWVHEHFDGLRSRLPEESLAHLSGIIGGTCTPEALAAERAFFEPRLEHIEGSTRGVRQAVENAEHCIAFRGREGGRLHAFLAR